MGKGENMGRTVSVFQSVKQTVRKPKSESGHSIIKGIISGAYRKEVEPIREKSKGGDSKGANELKNKLPVIVWAGQFADRKKLIKHSGLLCIDIDGIGAGTQDAIGKLRKHPSVYTAFVSPRGNGVKAVFRVPPDKDIHTCAWQAAAQEAEKQTGFKADEATKNINSLCFVSYDPEAYFNPDAEELAVSKSNKENKETKSNSPEELSQRKMIAIRLLGEIKWESNAKGYCKCPGIELHTGTDQIKDCIVNLDGAPTVHCFHNSCKPIVTELNSQLRREVGKIEATQEHINQNGSNKWFVLPGTDSLSIIDSAKRIFGVIGPKNNLFQRGGLIVEKAQGLSGTIALETVKPAAFRSRLEGYGHKVGAYRATTNGTRKLKQVPCPEEMAKALMESAPAKRLLPKISVVLNAPVLTEIHGKLLMLEPGYSEALGGVLILGKAECSPPDIPLEAAVTSLKGLFDDFNFQTPSDKSRAIASVFTPAFRIGGLIKGHMPIDMAEADQSQAGKTYRQKLVAAIYNEIPEIISMRRGGVGSFDESLSQALIRAKPIIMFDNIRGKLDSQTLEALLTCDGTFLARVPHRGEVAVDTSRLSFQMTSNGIETTIDLANRASFIRISKQPNGYCFKSYDEGDLLEHVKCNQPFYLGCVFGVIRHWHQEGKPRTTETAHDFREWAQTLNWIVREVFSEAPLMDAEHDAAKKRVTQPPLIWLRQLAIALERENRLGIEFTTTEIVNFCQDNEIEMPGIDLTEDEGKVVRRTGTLMKQLFSDDMKITVDQYTVTKREWEEKREDNYAIYNKKGYTFSKHEDTSPSGNDLTDNEPAWAMPVVRKGDSKTEQKGAAEFNNDPVIQKTLELFGGSIVDVQEPKTKNPSL